MTQTEGAFCISVNDTSPTPEFSASRTRRNFVIPVKIRSVLEKYGDVKAFNCINEDIESSTQASLISFAHPCLRSVIHFLLLTHNVHFWPTTARASLSTTQFPTSYFRSGQIINLLNDLDLSSGIFRCPRCGCSLGRAGRTCRG